MSEITIRIAWFSSYNCKARCVDSGQYVEFHTMNSSLFHETFTNGNWFLYAIDKYILHIAFQKMAACNNSQMKTFVISDYFARLTDKISTIWYGWFTREITTWRNMILESNTVQGKSLLEEKIYLHQNSVKGKLKRKFARTKLCIIFPVPVFCLLLGVSSDCAQPITGQVT